MFKIRIKGTNPAKQNNVGRGPLRFFYEEAERNNKRLITNKTKEEEVISVVPDVIQ
jgi:hypothetical protein